MSLNDTLFVGTPTNAAPLPLVQILDHYDQLRDAIGTTPSYPSEELSTRVCNASFVYAFNAYKAIGLILAQSYHEAGATILRQLWEVSLNLHYIAIDPAKRSSDFCNFTTIGYRKLLQKSGRENELDDFDTATARFQSAFRFRDRKDKERIHSSFATANVCNRANDLGEPWKREYELLYHLTSMHAHGSPGAVLHQIMISNYPNSQGIDDNSVCLVSLTAMKLMVRNVETMAKIGIIADKQMVLDVYSKVESLLD